MLSNPHSTLEANFKELYHSITFPSKHPSPLISNLSETRIYDSRYGWGRLWCWFYQIVHWMTGSSPQQQKLKKTLLNTHIFFQKEILKLQSHLKKYLEYIERSGKGYSLKENHYFSARNSITKWNAATQQFLKIAEKPNFESLLSKSTHISFKTPLFQSSTSKLLQTCQKIIDLEGLLRGPLPLFIIKKIIREKPLNALDQKDLNKWIYKINKLDEIKTVHSALKTLNDFYYDDKKNESKFHCLAILELYLEEKGCKIFQKPEPKHLKWRQNLEPGTPFLLSQSEIILGKEIYAQSSKGDQTRAYQIEGQPERIAIIAQNHIALSLRNLRLQKENSFNIPPALLLDISPDGKIATLESLKALNTIEWTSTEKNITLHDKEIIDALSDIIQTFIKQDNTPSTFGPQYLMFDAQFQLKALKPLITGPFDFNALEDFIFECASGNLTVFQELMLKSGLSSHSIAKFYQDILSNALQGDVTAADDLAGIYRISDPKVVDRATLLHNTILPMKDTLTLKLRESNPKLSQHLLEKKAYSILLNQYQSHKTAGILWPSFLRTCFKECQLPRI